MESGVSARSVLESVGPLNVEPGALSRGSLDAGVCRIPLLVYGGGRPGPVLYVQALQHGLELNGCEVMCRLIRSLGRGELSGTLILVPMANPLAARVHMQSFPYPDRPTARKINDMNRRWGDPLGGVNHVDQMVAALAPVVALADVVLDLHCHEYLYNTMVLTDMENPGCAELALAMGFPQVNSGKGTPGMFGRYCRETLGKLALTVEMPPLRRVDHGNAAVGHRGVVNAMRFLGMLEGDPELPAETIVYGVGEEERASVHAEREGFMSRYVNPGDKVREGQILAEIWDPGDFSVAQQICAPFDSYVVAIGRPPQVWGEPEHDFMNVGDMAAIVSTASRVITRT